jgi:hypothetical protein
MTQDEARREVFETAAALADALMDPVGRWATSLCETSCSPA